MSPVVTTYLVNQLVRGVDSEARDASSDFDWHIFPILNPDGHKYTQDKVIIITSTIKDIKQILHECKLFVQHQKKSVNC